MKVFFYLNIILVLVLTSCKEDQERTESYLYVFEKGNSAVTLKILNGNDYLIYDEPTKVNFEWKNVDNYSGQIIGAGIKIAGFKSNSKNIRVTETEITPPSHYIKNETLDILLKYQVENKPVEAKMFIPLKAKKN